MGEVTYALVYGMYLHNTGVTNDFRVYHTLDPKIVLVSYVHGVTDS